MLKELGVETYQVKRKAKKKNKKSEKITTRATIHFIPSADEKNFLSRWNKPSSWSYTPKEARYDHPNMFLFHRPRIDKYFKHLAQVCNKAGILIHQLDQVNGM